MILTLQRQFPSVDEHFYYSEVTVPDDLNVHQLFDIACAECGISVHSPIDIMIHGRLLDRASQDRLRDIGVANYAVVCITVRQTNTPPPVQPTTQSNQVKPSIPKTNPEQRLSFLYRLVNGVEQMKEWRISADEIERRFLLNRSSVKRNHCTLTHNNIVNYTCL